MEKEQPHPETTGPIHTSQNNDAAKNARRLLDTLSICESVSLALCELLVRYGDKLPKCAVEDFTMLADASRWIHSVGMQQVTKVSVVKGLLPAYRHVQLMKHEEVCDWSGGRISPSMRKVK